MNTVVFTPINEILPPPFAKGGKRNSPTFIKGGLRGF